MVSQKGKLVTFLKKTGPRAEPSLLALPSVRVLMPLSRMQVGA